MAAPGTIQTHSTESHMIQSFLAQPLDVIPPIRSSYQSNKVYVSTMLHREWDSFVYGVQHILIYCQFFLDFKENKICLHGCCHSIFNLISSHALKSVHRVLFV